MQTTEDTERWIALIKQPEQDSVLALTEFQKFRTPIMIHCPKKGKDMLSDDRSEGSGC